MNILARVEKKTHDAEFLYREVAEELIVGPLIFKSRRLAKVISRARRFRSAYKLYDAYKKDRLPEHIGNMLFNKAVRKPCAKSCARMLTSIVNTSRPTSANNLSAGRTNEFTKAKAQFTKMVIILHEANKAGNHVDIHIGNISIVKRLPQDFKISKNTDGSITEATKDRIMQLVRSEFEGNAWLAQNLDHSPKDAETSWIGEENGPTGYGAGESRQVVSSKTIYMHGSENSLEISAPHIINNRKLYLYKIMDKNDNRSVPIISLGVKKPNAPAVKDRLHLTYDQDIDKFKRIVGKDGDVRIKYDGASAYIESGPKGTRLWSPRISKKTGQRIEYTAKVPGIEKIKTSKKMLSMGELTFKRDGKYLKAHEIGGILNGSNLDPTIKPEIRAYRADKIDNKSIGEVSQSDNHSILKSLVSKSGGLIKLPEKADINNIDRHRDIEGFVGVPANASINDGRKFKFKDDEADWEVTSVNLKPGDKGGIAGVVNFESLESGKPFKIGASSMGSREEVIQIMNNPNDYIGRVAKVNHFGGHEGRAAQFDSWHLDK